MWQACRSELVRFFAIIIAVFVFAGAVSPILGGDALAQSSSVRPPDNAVTNAPAQPGEGRVRDVVDAMNPAKSDTTLKSQGPNSVSTIWGELRAGETATVSIPDKKAAVLVQDGGMKWLQWRAKGGHLQKYGGYALIAIVVLLLLFFLLRGRIRIEHGSSKLTIERFKPIERFGHWLLAGSFIVLALSGLNLLYGKDYLMPLIGKEAFASVALAGKWAHNNMAWAFMLGLIMVFLMWVVHNVPSRVDLKWIAQGGGLFSKGVHPPARKFNAGQKLIFWGTIVLGASISLSGISLLMPGEFPMFAKTFAVLNSLGYPAIMGVALPETLSPMQELHYAQIWHTIVAFAMIFMIIAHIYIGSVGMEGAFDAMGTGQVDRNWAMEHHDLWVEEEDAKTGFRTPAE
ncbi:MAG: formate dehydrogenase subunit gamma [Pseudomonadota bacterium]